MKVLGEPLFSHDETGRLKARIGTVFLRTPGLVTLNGTHATQRVAWIAELNRERLQSGQPKLTSFEIDAEISHSVDLLFDDPFVLIRPDPNAMDYALLADELLQTVVSKRRIRFLNIQYAPVRNALRARGENWRMSRIPVSPEEMNRLIANSRVSIGALPIYFFNRSTGSRFLTLGSLAWLATRPDGLFRAQLAELVQYCGQRNRFGFPEIDIFPPGCGFTRQAFEALDTEGLPSTSLRAAFQKLLEAFRQAVPESLQDETPENTEWRNLMCSTLTTQPNSVASEELVQGISPEFYMQIEWLPGCRIVKGELIFDSVCEEQERAMDDDGLGPGCDARAKAVIFNYMREFDTIEYINIGRIARSLSIRAQTDSRRASVYVVQVKEAGRPEPELRILRFQKWGVTEHLDEGKDLLRSIMEAEEYTDYVLDRRLGCRQLGMVLPEKVTTGRIPETYCGANKAYHGTHCWSVYFERSYVRGCATDKILPHRYTNAEFNRRLARFLGEAAAVNCIVGRTFLDKAVMFDDGDEVIELDGDQLPARLIVSDPTGSFTQFDQPLADSAKAYAGPVNRRAGLMGNAAEFADIYLASFRKRLERVQQDYQLNRRAFDNLFKHRPIDTAGSFSYRWQCTLARLARTDAGALTEAIRRHIEVFNP